VHVAPPVYFDGVLVCSIPGGRYFAVDLVNGSVLWSYQIDLTAGSTTPAAASVRLRQLAQLKSNATDRWLATAVQILGNRVILTAFESESLYCLDFRSGKLLWEVPRRDGQFVAGAQDDVVVVVGRSALRAYRLDDGAAAWPSEFKQFPDGLVPAGTGYFGDKQYYLPFTRGEVGIFDLATGQLTTKVLPLTNQSLGNLLPKDEYVVAIGLSGIDRFATISRANERAPADVTAEDDDATVTTRAKVLIAMGEFAEALQLLTDRYEDSRDEQISELLLEALTLALQDEPDRYRRFIEEVTSSDLAVTHPEQAVRLAERLVESEQPDAARKIFSALTDSGDRLRDFMPASASRSVRLDRRIATGLKRLGESRREPATPSQVDLESGQLSAENNLTALLEKAEIQITDKQFDIRNQNPDARQRGLVVVEDAHGPVDDLVITYQTAKFVAGRPVNVPVLVVQDRWGRLLFEVELPTFDQRSVLGLGPTIVFQHAVVTQRTLVYHRGDIIAAVDLTANSGRLLWTAKAWPATQNWNTEYQAWRQQLGAMDLQSPLRRGESIYGDRTFCRLVATTNDCVCYQRGRELVAVDPRTGEAFWVRDDLPPGSDLMGGPNHILVTPPAGQPSALLSSLDGRLVATRPVLPIAKRLTAHQGRALLYDQEVEPRQLGLYDPVEDRFVWRQELAADAVPVVGTGVMTGVVDAKGELKLVDLSTGDPLVTANLGSLEDVRAAVIFPFGETIVVAADQTPDDKANRANRNAPLGEMNISGKLIGLNAKDGKQRWNRPLKDQRLRTSQPFGLPVLLACNFFQRPRQGNRYLPGDGVFDCIDVRTGKSLKSVRRERTAYLNYRFRFDDESNTAIYDSGSQKLQLQFVPK
jgi:outer membrane protein assembly factor BamB